MFRLPRALNIRCISRQRGRGRDCGIHIRGAENAEWKLDISRPAAWAVRKTVLEALKYYNGAAGAFTGSRAGALTTVAR